MAPLHPFELEGNQVQRGEAEPRQQDKGEESQDKDANHGKGIGGSSGRC